MQSGIEHACLTVECMFASVLAQEIVLLSCVVENTTLQRINILCYL